MHFSLSGLPAPADNSQNTVSGKPACKASLPTDALDGEFEGLAHRGHDGGRLSCKLVITHLNAKERIADAWHHRSRDQSFSAKLASPAVVQEFRRGTMRGALEA